jgi:hypothetical protein
VVQSDKSNGYCEGRAQQFLYSIGTLLDQMTADQFAKHVASLSTQLLEKPKTVYQDARICWAEISGRTYHFGQNHIDNAELQLLVKGDLVAFHRLYVAPDAPKRRQLSAWVVRDPVTFPQKKWKPDEVEAQAAVDRKAQAAAAKRLAAVSAVAAPALCSEGGDGDSLGVCADGGVSGIAATEQNADKSGAKGDAKGDMEEKADLITNGKLLAMLPPRLFVPAERMCAFQAGLHQAPLPPSSSHPLVHVAVEAGNTQSTIA